MQNYKPAHLSTQQVSRAHAAQVSSYASQFVSDIRVSPGTADNLRHLPPTVVMVCDLDPLRDAGIKYFQRLQACGCRAALVRCPSVHGAFTLQDILPEARQAFDDCLLQLRELLKDA
jgi:acetyl esterase/lipase